MKIIVASPVWSLNGVNVFAANLVRGLNAAGADVHLLLTWPEIPDPKPMPLPADLPVARLPVDADASWPVRWRAMIRYLEAHAPCVYLPNYDFWHSCVCPVLPRSVAVVGIVHSDDPQHYEHVARLGRYWDAVVAVSPAIRERVAEIDPALESRLSIIPYGVEAPAVLPERSTRPDRPLHIVYAGRLVQRQKRVLDLPAIMAALADRDVPATWTIIGAGSEEAALREACAALAGRVAVTFAGTLPNAQMQEAFTQGDALIVTSEFEGLPIGVLEAMAWGCVPVVTDIRSGIPELIEDGANGCRVPPGDTEGFAARLASLQRDPAARRRMAEAAHRTIVTQGYRTQDMVDRYLALFQRVTARARSGAYRRPRGKIARASELTWKDAIPPRVRSTLAAWRRGPLHGPEK